MYTSTFFKNFFLVNILLIALLQYVSIRHNSQFDSNSLKMFIGMLIVDAVVIFGQYSFLVKTDNWVYRSLIFLISMFIFLFLFGLISYFIQDQPDNTWVDHIVGAFFMSIFGGLMKGIWLWPIVILVNWLLRKQLF